VAHYVSALLRDAAVHFRQPTTRQSVSIAERFDELVRRWREETASLSSTTAQATHAAYQRIIGMGPDALLLILRELEDHGGHWFWALRAITGLDPVRAEERGRVSLMRQAWLRWAREQGFRW
jgi:hypothetical protein